MHPEIDATADSTVEIIPPLFCGHPDDVAEVTPVGKYLIRVRFHDGTEGDVDVADLVESPSAGVFASLRDPAIFVGVRVVLGAVTWPGEIDLAPDAMYDALKRDGFWKL